MHSVENTCFFFFLKPENFIVYILVFVSEDRMNNILCSYCFSFYNWVLCMSAAAVYFLFSEMPNLSFKNGITSVVASKQKWGLIC